MPTGTPIAIGFYPGSASPVDERYLNDGTPYANTAEVLATIPVISRHVGLTVNVAGVEYWFWPDVNTLAAKVGTLSLADGSVTLVKMAAVASGTVFYRKSAGIGSPEVQTLATLRSDLNIPADPTAALANKVDKITGYTLLSPTQATVISNQSGTNTGDETEATILAKLGVDSVLDGQDIVNSLETKVDKILGKGLSTNDFTNDEQTKLSGLIKPQKIHLPAYSDVADRIANAESGTDYPATFTLSVASPGGLQIVHNLNRDCHTVSVWSIDINGKRQERNAAAYTGLLAPNTNTLVVEGLATVVKAIDIYLQFV